MSINYREKTRQGDGLKRAERAGFEPAVRVNAHTLSKRDRLTEKTPKGTFLSKAGLNSELKHIKAMFNWAVKSSLLTISPFNNVKFVSTPEKSIRFLTGDEIESLYRAMAMTQDVDAADLSSDILSPDGCKAV